jgi:hypothetical protein
MRIRHLLLASTSCLFIASTVWLGCGGSDGSTIGNSSGGDAATEGGAAGGDGSSSANGEGGAGSKDGASGSNTEGGGGAGPGGNTTSEPCGTQTCNIPAQVCCVSGGGGSTMYTCAASCAEAGGGGGGGDTTSLQCTSSANCAAGSICCIHQSQNGGAEAACVMGTSCGQNSAQLCDPNASVSGCPGDAGQRSMCSSDNIGDWGLSPPFATCGGVGN